MSLYVSDSYPFHNKDMIQFVPNPYPLILLKIISLLIFVLLLLWLSFYVLSLILMWVLLSLDMKGKIYIIDPVVPINLSFVPKTFILVSNSGYYMSHRQSGCCVISSIN